VGQSEVFPCLAHRLKSTGRTIFMQNTKISPGTILVYRKIMKHPTFDFKVCVKLNFVRPEAILLKIRKFTEVWVKGRTGKKGGN
jgi:hypothetical protein